MIKMYNEHKNLQSNNLIKSHDNDMGYDIRCPYEVMIPPCTHKIINSGLHVYIPPILGAFIKSRSGLAINHSIEVSNAGVIDSGFCESCIIKVYNRSLNDPFLVNPGDRIAQMIFLLRPEAFFNQSFFSCLETEFDQGKFFSIKEVSKEEFKKLELSRSGVGSTGLN